MCPPESVWHEFLSGLAAAVPVCCEAFTVFSSSDTKILLRYGNSFSAQEIQDEVVHDDFCVLRYTWQPPRCIFSVQLQSWRSRYVASLDFQKHFSHVLPQAKHVFGTVLWSAMLISFTPSVSIWGVLRPCFPPCNLTPLSCYGASAMDKWTSTNRQLFFLTTFPRSSVQQKTFTCNLRNEPLSLCETHTHSQHD